MALLELQDVHFAYGEREVLAGVNLALDAGEVAAVVGPNGAGKTTLLRVAGGLLPPGRGRVVLDGRALEGMARRAAARLMAAVPADEEAVFPFTVRESVTLGRHPWRETFARLTDADHERVDASLAATSLEAFADRTVPALSSGERQRVAIARCLVQDGRVCLLDEPTSHLDLGQRLRMLRLFRAEARSKGRAVLAVLHDLNLAAAFSDRVVLLVDGRVTADGPPAGVFTPDRIEAAFGTPVHVLPHPDHGAPVIVPLGEGDAP